MARMNVTGSAYRVPRRKAEIARDNRWQKTAKLTTKKDLESKKRGLEGKGMEESRGRDQKTIAEEENPESLEPGKAGGEK